MLLGILHPMLTNRVKVIWIFAVHLMCLGRTMRVVAMAASEGGAGGKYHRSRILRFLPLSFSWLHIPPGDAILHIKVTFGIALL